MIETNCKFYYGFTITSENCFIDFKEGTDPDLEAVLTQGEYSFDEFIIEVSRALNAASALTYTVSINRTTRYITITTSSNFKLLGATGVNNAASALPLMGFSADTSLNTTQTGSAAGYEWIPQFLAQDYVDFEDNQTAVESSIKQSATGDVQAFRFGTKKIMECRFKYITDRIQRVGSPIANDSSGVANARDFLAYAVTKATVDFIPDVDDPDTFIECILESTDVDSNGMGFKLKEQYGEGLPGYYETGILKFRKL